MVFTYSDQEWVWGLLPVSASAGFSLGGLAAPAAASLLGQPEPPWEKYRASAKTVQGLVQNL